MQIFPRKSWFLSGRQRQRVKSKACRHVQSPILIYHNLSFDFAKSEQEVIQQVCELVDRNMAKDQFFQNVIVAIDISCPPDLITTGIAGQLAQTILSSLDQQYPVLRDRFIGISDDAKKLPLRDLMQTGKLALEEIDNQHLFVFE